ncbi:MAG: hypothetical protein R3C25_05190 [Hyphomonadaceae bacterium]
MDAITPPKPAQDATAPLRQSSSEAAPAAEAAQKRIADHAAAQRDELVPDKLQVQLDRAAGRFVQTLSDPSTQETLRRYPSESQLAYSRAVMAYLRALAAR